MGARSEPESECESLEHYARSWLDVRPGLAIRTRETYLFLLDHLILPDLGTIEVSRLSPTEIRVWHARHFALHASSAAKAYRLLSTIMRTAVDDGLISTSPCRVRGAGTERAAERPVATVDEILRLHAAMIPRLRIAIDLAVWCHLRRGEMLGLERRDVDLPNQTVHIERSRTFLTTGRSVTKDTKTRAGRRIVSVPSAVWDRLLDHLNRFVDSSPTSALLVGRDGLPISSVALQRAWNSARVATNRTDLHLHDLRHTGLTLAASTGATTAELMRRAGHVSSEAALRYQHATLDRDRALAARLDSLAATQRTNDKQAEPISPSSTTEG